MSVYARQVGFCSTVTLCQEAFAHETHSRPLAPSTVNSWHHTHVLGGINKALVRCSFGAQIPSAQR
eukprot:2524074-Amphidinium_carterae.1